MEQREHRISSIHLIPSAKVPSVSSTFLQLLFYTWQPISSCGGALYQYRAFLILHCCRPHYRPQTPMVIKEIPFKCSTCKTSAGVYASIFQRNPFKNFFHFIFFPGKSLVKNLKTKKGITSLTHSLTFSLHKHGGRRSIAGIKESFKGNAARARLARGF